MTTRYEVHSETGEKFDSLGETSFLEHEAREVVRIYGGTVVEVTA